MAFCEFRAIFVKTVPLRGPSQLANRCLFKILTIQDADQIGSSRRLTHLVLSYDFSPPLYQRLETPSVVRLRVRDPSTDHPVRT